MARTLRIQIATAIFLCACSGWYFKVNIWGQLPQLSFASSDFLHYYRAGQAILGGRTPFGDPEYLYPPLVAFVFAPFALISYVTARSLWFLLSHVCLLTAAWVMWRALGRGRLAACCVAAAWALGGAAAESLALGQIGPLLVLLVALAYTRESLGRGAAVGTGLSLKFIPGVLGVALMLRRDRRSVAGLLGAFLLLTVVPWAVVAYVMAGPRTPVNRQYWMGTPATLSWSIPSVVLRALTPPRRGRELPHDWYYGNVAANLRLSQEKRLASVGAAVITLGVGVILLSMACGLKLNPEQFPWAMAGLLSLGLAASPVCWTHYQILQYPGLAFILYGTIRLRLWSVAVWGLLSGALLYQIPVTILRVYYHQHGGWTAASPPALYIWTSVAPLACLSLFWLCIKQIRKRALQG